MTAILISAPATHVALTTERPLLIILTPYSTRNKWWIDRAGLLYLRADGVITWFSDDFVSEEPWGRSMTDIVLGFKHLAKECWNPLLSESGSVWHELSFGECEYSSNQVLIPVYPSTFTLGDSN